MLPAMPTIAHGPTRQTSMTKKMMSMWLASVMERFDLISLSLKVSTVSSIIGAVERVGGGHAKVTGQQTVGFSGVGELKQRSCWWWCV